MVRICCAVGESTSFSRHGERAEAYQNDRAAVVDTGPRNPIRSFAAAFK
jgi:hypothetical protein